MIGLFRRSRPIDDTDLASLSEAARRDSGPHRLWTDGTLAIAAPTDATGGTSQPVVDEATGIVFSGGGRVDNRDELISPLSLSAASPDEEFLRGAFLKWHADAPPHLYGDWSFAAWLPKERLLFLARDHFGNSALYYYSDPNVFAFALSSQALRALNVAPVELDDLYIAQVLTSWSGRDGSRTAYAAIRRLPPAHHMSVTDRDSTVRRYWVLEDVPVKNLGNRADYIQAFRETFDRAVRARLRIAGNGNIGVSLSGGLDSGSVAVTAARMLRDRGERLIAFTSQPIFDTGAYTGDRFGDEAPFAETVTQFAGNVDLHRIAAVGITPIQAIRTMLTIIDEPAHSACSFYWIVAMLEATRSAGCRILLNGQMGNAGISWHGDPLSQPTAYQLRRLGVGRWAKRHLRAHAPQGLIAAVNRQRYKAGEWYALTAINREMAAQIDLFDRWLDDWNTSPTPGGRAYRYDLLRPSSNPIGSIFARTGPAYGLAERDPTADARLLEFTLSVPDDVYIDPKTGMSRWLIRAAMEGRLPDEVRLNTRRGQQAGDLVPRLRASVEEVECALDEVANGPGAAYVDIPTVRGAWQVVMTQDTPIAHRKAVTIVTRGIMAGLFVNGVSRGA